MNEDKRKTHIPTRGRTRKLTVEEIQKRIFEIHGNIVFLDVSTYKNTHTRCRFIDREFGEWWTTPNWLFSRKTGHPKRGHITGGIHQRIPVKDIKLRIEQIYGDVVCVDETTYTHTNKKARFIDKDFGEWWAKPIDVLRNNSSHLKRQQIMRKETCLLKYGVENTSQVPEFAKKQAFSTNNSCVLYHWKTSEKLVCVGSYEKRVVEYLNQNQINFDFQIPFDMPDGRRYFVDLYLKEQNKYVEIKGYFRKDAREKWEWFHKEYTNSELWNKEKLKEMKIL